MSPALTPARAAIVRTEAGKPSAAKHSMAASRNLARVVRSLGRSSAPAVAALEPAGSVGGGTSAIRMDRMLHACIANVQRCAAQPGAAGR
ncbi:hypothetical protein GCM10009750_34410 [Agromyces salentinus]|uniref:Uncharacterized protein n=1 Tax=Agromyces salentinus TaxID=269421 RepID=A0ABN2MZP1_9MICO